MKCQWLMEAISFDDKPPVEKIYTDRNTAIREAKCFAERRFRSRVYALRNSYVGQCHFDSEDVAYPEE